LFYNDFSKNQGGFGRFWAGIGDLRAGRGRFARRHCAAFEPANACHFGRAGRDLCAFCVSARVFGRVSGRGVATPAAGSRRAFARKVSALAPTPGLTMRKIDLILHYEIIHGGCKAGFDSRAHHGMAIDTR
jgi:hypothetical protein